MDKLIIAVCAVNLLASVIYSAAVLRRKKTAWLGLFFAAVPVFGFALYFICRGFIRPHQGHAYDRDSLIKRYEMGRMEKIPELQKELNVIPVEDAMAVGSSQEKRSLLLDQLKQDMHQNYKYILPAGADRDSEAAHYVAASKMEVDRSKREGLKKLQKVAEKHRGDWKAQHDYLSGLQEYLDSGLITDKEALTYEGEYCRIFERIFRSAEVSAGETGIYLTCLIGRGRDGEAEAFWKKCPSAQKNEAGYRRMLELYYDHGEKQKFYDCLQALKASDVVLSPEGLRMLRFWDARRN